jgi:hypothetical protein
MIPTNGNETKVEVLAERIANLSKKVDEQVAINKTAVEAALTAISVAKVDQERTVSVAFAASQSAINKTEESQKESNRSIGLLQNDVVRLKEVAAQGSGNAAAQSKDKEQSNFNLSLVLSVGFNALMFLAMVWKMIQPMVK